MSSRFLQILPLGSNLQGQASLRTQNCCRVADVSTWLRLNQAASLPEVTGTA